MSTASQQISANKSIYTWIITNKRVQVLCTHSTLIWIHNIRITRTFRKFSVVSTPAFKNDVIIYSVSPKKSSLQFSDIFSQMVGNFWSIFYTPIISYYLRTVTNFYSIILPPTLTNGTSVLDLSSCPVTFQSWQSINQSVSQSKHNYTVPYVASESEAQMPWLPWIGKLNCQT